MLSAFLLTLGLIAEPNFSVDIPINLVTGTVDILDNRVVEKSDDFPLELRRRYHYRDGRYRSDYLHQTLAWESKEGEHEILTLYLSGYEFVKFVKDSDYTYKPYFGQEFPFYENDGSAVNHPENVEVTRVGKYLVVLYLDGRKFVYEKEEKSDFFDLIKEHDAKGFVTHYNNDKDGDLDSIIRKGPEGQMLSFTNFGYNLSRRTVFMDALTNSNKYTYELRKLGKKQYIYASYKNDIQLDKAAYDEDNACRIRYIEDHQYGHSVFSYDNEGRVTCFIKRFKKGDAIYNIRYFDRYTEVVIDKEKSTFYFDEFGRIIRIKKLNGYEKRITYNEHSEVMKLEFLDCNRLDYVKEYVFDKARNVLKLIETIDGKKYETKYEYDARCRKIKEIDYRGLVKVFGYLGESFFITSVEESLDQETIEKRLYEYDKYKRLVKEVVKEGDFCRIKRYEYCNESKNFEKCSMMTKSFIDSVTRAEKRLGAFKYIYKNRDLSTVVMLDEHQIELGKEEYFYDEHRRAVKKVNFLGEEEIFSYDGFDRVVRKKCGEYIEEYEYGEDNNIVEKRYLYKSDFIAKESFHFDFRGRLRSKKHSYGESFSYGYDHMDRKNVVNDVRYRFDPLNRTTSIRSHEGEKFFKYCGEIEPSFESYFDGTFVETTKEGDLCSKCRERKGVEIYKTYDCLGNLVKEVCGEKVFTYKYKGRTLLEKKGPQDFSHKYFYDGAGRLIKEEGGVCAIYEYDAFDRAVYKMINNLVTRTEYDLLGRKKKESIGAKTINYKYDVLGNLSEKGGQLFEYDHFGNIIASVDLYGLKTRVQYSENKRETIFPNGGRRKEEFDEKRRPIVTSEYDGAGALAYIQKDTFNAKGKCTQRLVETFGREVSTKEINCEYDRHGSLITEVVKDEVGIFKTQFEYNKYRQLVKKIKPDGIFLTYEYDQYGRVINLYSSDNSVNFRVEYDLADREISSIDYLRGVTFLREYDGSGNLCYENFKGANFIRFEYFNGARTKCFFPDGSFIEYQYQKNGELYSIDRFDRNNKYLYSHQYSYNNDGLVSGEYHPFNVFTSFLEYNNAKRAISLTSPFYGETIHIKDNLVMSVKNKDMEKSFIYDQHEQLIGESDKSYNYVRDPNLLFDKCGRVVFDGKIEFTYDALDRVVGAENKETKEKERYLYDFYGRLRRKEGKIFQVYIYDGDHEIGSIQTRKAPVLGIINPKTGRKVAIEHGPLVAIPIYDLFGNVKMLIDAKTNKKVESYSFNSYGQTKAMEWFFNPWRYQGMRAHAFNSALFFPGRAYNINQRLFMSKDPLRQAMHFSLYQYCLNNPLSFKDEDGLAAEAFDFTNFKRRFLPQKLRKRLDRAFFDSNNEDKKIYYVNGLDTTRKYLHETTAFMNQFFSGAIGSYYRRCGDSIFGVLDELMGCRARARNLSLQLQNDIANGVSDVYLFGHSAGGATISSVIALLNEDQRQKINVITFGSASIIDPSLVKSATNYYSTRDYYLSLFQFISRPLDSMHYMQKIPAQVKSGFMDHSIMGDTYRNKWMESLAGIQLQ